MYDVGRAVCAVSRRGRRPRLPVTGRAATASGGRVYSVTDVPASTTRLRFTRPGGLSPFALNSHAQTADTLDSDS